MMAMAVARDNGAHAVGEGLGGAGLVEGWLCLSRPVQAQKGMLRCHNSQTGQLQRAIDRCWLRAHEQRERGAARCPAGLAAVLKFPQTCFVPRLLCWWRRRKLTKSKPNPNLYMPRQADIARGRLPVHLGLAFEPSAIVRVCRQQLE